MNGERERETEWKRIHPGVPLVATLMSAWSPEVIAGVDRGYAGIVSEQWWDWQFWDVSSLVRCPDAAAE